MTLTATDVKALLRDRFDPNEYAIFFEVGEHRRADAVAVNKWRSRGYAIHGFEIKVARGDWLKELKAPAKADDVIKWCDHWWLVAPTGVLKDAELPINWGYYEVASAGPGWKLRLKTRAPKLHPKPLDRTFALRLLRQAGQDNEAMIRHRVDAALEKHRLARDSEIERRVEERTHGSRDYKARYEELLEALGVETWDTTPADVRRAMQLVLRLELTKDWGKLSMLRNQLAAMVKTIDDTAADFQ